jgi:hypothetical protein
MPEKPERNKSMAIVTFDRIATQEMTSGVEVRHLRFWRAGFLRQAISPACRPTVANIRTRISFHA